MVSLASFEPPPPDEDISTPLISFGEEWIPSPSHVRPGPIHALKQLRNSLVDLSRAHNMSIVELISKFVLVTEKEITEVHRQHSKDSLERSLRLECFESGHSRPPRFEPARSLVGTDASVFLSTSTHASLPPLSMWDPPLQDKITEAQGLCSETLMKLNRDAELVITTEDFTSLLSPCEYTLAGSTPLMEGWTSINHTNKSETLQTDRSENCPNTNRSENCHTSKSETYGKEPCTRIQNPFTPCPPVQQTSARPNPRARIGATPSPPPEPTPS
eukprot:Hpha_TRINITY_DN16114_c6_g2::TRINITY_DN16114_c6_g2_i1::g.5630::m.5630